MNCSQGRFVNRPYFDKSRVLDYKSSNRIRKGAAISQMNKERRNSWPER